MSIKRLIHSGTGLLLIALAFVAFNMLSGLLLRDLRLDLTEQRLYSLSDGTRQILAGLDEPVDLYFFYSDRASREQAQWRQQAQQVSELLDSFERASDGRLRLHRLDPQPFSDAEEQAGRFGIQPMPLVAGGDPLYLGLTGVNALDEQQVIPAFAPGQQALLEYQIARLVQRLSGAPRPLIGLLSSIALEGGSDPMSGQHLPPARILEDIRQQFALREIEPAAGFIPEEVRVLLLVQPQNLSQPMLHAIDQFVLGGGRLLAFIDPLAEAAGGSTGNLDPLLATWGVELLAGKVVADGNYAQQIAGPDGRPMPHPGWLALPAEGIDAADVATAGLEAINLASAGVLRPLAQATTSFQPLLLSSSYAQPLDVELLRQGDAPAQLIRHMQPDGQRHVLAARISGPARSAYPQGIEGQADGLRSAENIQLILVADSDLLGDGLWVAVHDFFGEQMAEPFADNGTLVINALDNLAGSDALIAVRSRGQWSRPFSRIEALQQAADSRLRAREAALDQRLRETEVQLAELQRNSDPSRPGGMDAQQRQLLERVIGERIALRQQLREVRWQLQEDIDRLQSRIKLLNIAGVPLLLVLIAGLWWLWRRR